MSKTMPAVLALFLAASAVTAGEPEQKAQPPQKSPTPLKVQVVFNRFQGEKKVASHVYALPVSADDGRTDIRMGIQVPLKYEGKEFPGNVVFKSVGNWVSCSAEALGDGRFKLKCGLEQSSVDSPEQDAQKGGSGSGSPPVLRSFSSDATLFLRDGQTAQYVVATDPLTGEVLKVDVTLTIAK